MTVIDTTNMEDLEAWRNATKGKVVLNRIGAGGGIIADIVAGGKVTHLTAQERLINQEKAATPGQDVFQNGVMVPERLPDTEEAAKLLANPNVMSDTAKKALFKGTLKQFEARLAEITASWILEDLLVVCQDVDGSVKQQAAIRARLAQIAPDAAVDATPATAGPQIKSSVSTGGPGDSSKPRPVTPG